MKILAVGTSAHMGEIVTNLRQLSPNCITTSTDLTGAIRQIRESQDVYHWILLEDEPNTEVCAELANMAHISTGTKPLVSSLQTSDTSTLTPHDDDLGKWRNVLNFAARTPEAFPALRDAMSANTTLIQYHAPCQKSA